MSATEDPNPISNENLMQVNSFLRPSSIFIFSEYEPGGVYPGRTCECATKKSPMATGQLVSSQRSCVSE